ETQAGATFTQVEASRELPEYARRDLRVDDRVSIHAKADLGTAPPLFLKVLGYGWSGGSYRPLFTIEATPTDAWTRFEARVQAAGTVEDLQIQWVAPSEEPGTSLPNVVYRYEFDALLWERWTDFLVFDEGRSLWSAQVVDPAFGPQEHSPAIPVLVDQEPPSGAVNVSLDAPYVPSVSTTLHLDGNDLGSGVRDMMVSNRPDFQGALWERYQPTRAWTLDPPLNETERQSGGARQVHVKFRDGVGRESAVATDDVIVDPLAPVEVAGSYVPGEQWLTQTQVEIGIQVRDNLAVKPGSARFSVSTTTANPSWKDVVDPTSPDGRSLAVGGIVTVTAEGRYQAGFRVTDVAGNELRVFRPLNVDLNAPSCGVNVVPTISRSPTVALALSSTDAMSGTKWMFVWDDLDGASLGEPYATTGARTVPSVDGVRRVFAHFEDHVGHLSTACSDTFVLDTRAPIVTPTSPPDGMQGVPISWGIQAAWADDKSASASVAGVAPASGWMTLQDVTHYGTPVNVTSLAERTATHVTYDPPAPLLPRTTYRVCVGVADAVGNANPGRCWTFTTA
ncbi:MAG TPA: Ig-like domain-containing protein, partial [Candidatus Thermoplasmatota archaeon]|nr:Ig-like domain-containing protein [Candidatus Thermoplasmatota archaeon]